MRDELRDEFDNYKRLMSEGIYDEADTVARLENAGFDVEPHSVIAGAIKISPAVAVNSLPGFEQGRISVQDPAAQLAAGLLETGEEFLFDIAAELECE